ncbi:MAG: methyltransferase domain-containing protein [Hyphomicrobiaceae bacterium]|nr:methyltransferase domain-containing protein [Hyphomicrobiaceae bacterium]
MSTTREPPLPRTSTAADQRFWDRHARKYARDPIKDMAGYERTLEHTRARLTGADTVLELGCGTGTTALKLAPHVARLLATDISPEMIAIARDKAAAAGCANLHLATGTPDRIDASDGTFDAVLAFNLLHLVADRRQAYGEVRRLLKPGGLFITKTPCLSEMNVLIRLMVPVMRLIGKAPHVSFFTAGDLEREIAAAGFTIVERARHGSTGKDPRIYIVASTPAV